MPWARATISSTARRAMPRAAAATPAASRLKFGNRPIGASTSSRPANGCTERPSGTNTSVIRKSVEPVPLRPDEYQVSSNSTSAAGANIRWNSPPSVCVPPRIQVQWLVPLPHGHCPLTRCPPSTRLPVPFGANTPPATDAGSPKIADAHSGASRAASDDVVLAIITHQPAAPSASATAAMVRTRVIGSHSGPPYTAGTQSRNKPASRSASATGVGRRRNSSPSAACSRTSASRARAASTGVVLAGAVTAPSPAARPTNSGRR